MAIRVICLNPESVPKRKLASRWLLILSIALAGLLLYAATRGVGWGEVAKTLASCRPGYLLVAWMLLTFSMGLRALRWRLLLSVAQPVRFQEAFWAVTAGALGNNYLPARAGEVIRSAYISSKAGITNSFALATALGERMLDALILSAIGASAMTVLGHVPAAFLHAAEVVAAAAAIGGVFMALAPHLKAFLQRVFAAFARRIRFAAALEKMVLQFLLGMRAFHDFWRLCCVAMLSVAAWMGDAMAAVAVGRSLSEPLDFLQAVFLVAALGLSSGLPSTPGYVGIYQFVAVSVLTPLGFIRSQALAYIIVFQAAIYAVVTFWGSIGLWKARGVLGGLSILKGPSRR
jgi:uncharacterized protein (TIRG00374 family)